MIELKNVSKIYNSKQAETKALNNVSLKLEDNGFVFILGPSGSGKSTLLNLIGGLDNHTSGDILVNGLSLNNYTSAMKDEYRNENIGFIFQNYNMISHLTIFENISLPLSIRKVSKKEINDKTNKLIKQFGLEKEKNKYPNNVSGGQLQRAAIARSIINDPKIILADEPTGALDSKNTKIVMDYLKGVSKERLVVMVSHNESLAKEYGTRVIRLLDGEVVSDENHSTNDFKKIDKVNSNYKKISFKASLKLSLRNLFSKKFRSALTILASSIGIVSTCLVIMVSNSMSNYTEYAQKQALSSYPITISSNITSDSDITPDDTYTEYPDDNIINVTNTNTAYYEHINVFSNDYLDYLKKMDSSIYSVIDYGTSLNMHLMANNSKGYEYISSSSYLRSIENSDYIASEYDLLYGDSYPSDINSLALVIDKNNCIDAYILNYLGIDYKDITSYTFEEICNKEFKVIKNDDYYQYNDSTMKYAINQDKEYLYNNSDITLKITCVIRPKSTAVTKLYNTGLLYTSALSEYMHEDASNSEIVLKQLEYGIEKNVFTNQPYTDSVGDFTTISKEYLLESNLKALGYYYSISYIRIYTDKFDNRLLINQYLEDYNTDKEFKDQIVYRDYMGSITEEFSKFIKILSTVLIIFSTIALLVSCIMIALLMYVSVVERTKEIGILRCIGYSKENVSTIFLSEASIMGFTSGVIGVIIAVVAIKPILKFVSNVVEESYSSRFDIETITKVDLNFIQILILVLGSTLIAIIAALIPAFIASKKAPVEAINHQGD